MAAGKEDWSIEVVIELIGHRATHQDGGADEINLEGLEGDSAELAAHKALTPSSDTKPHDIREVDVTSSTTPKNKAVSNLLAKGWEDHKDDATIHIPTGLIAIWSGTLANIPSGWALCDGGDTRPNLLDKFLKCVPNGSTNPGSTGGASSHTHGAGSYTQPTHTHTGTVGASTMSETAASGAEQHCAHESHLHSFTTNAGGADDITGTSASASSLPPYYEVAFIIST